MFPGTTFALIPADIVSQILNFGLPAPIDVQIVGSNFDANHVYANKLLRKIARVPGVADARIQQASNNPTFGVEVDRTRAAQVGLNEADVARSLQESLSGSFKVAPTFWINPKNGVAYPIVAQTPQYWLDSMSSLENIPASREDVSQIARRPGDDQTRSKPGGRFALRGPAGPRHLRDEYMSATLARCPPTSSKVVDETANELPAGSSVVLRGQTQTMAAAYQQLFVGIALAVVLIYLLIVVNFQSWLDPFVIVKRAADRAGWNRLDVVHHQDDALGSRIDGRDHVHGRGDRQQHSCGCFARERLAEGADAVTAAIDAGFTRFRPVLMTALAMIIGMSPMALSGELNAPLGRAVIGGLACSTVATLLFVPAVFASFMNANRDGRLRPRRTYSWRGQQYEPGKRRCRQSRSAGSRPG